MTAQSHLNGMSRLPVELVARIIEIVEQDYGGLASLNSEENYSICKTFVYNAALVCKGWNTLVKQLDMTLCVDSNIPLGKLAKMVTEGKVYNIRHLCITIKSDGVDRDIAVLSQFLRSAHVCSEPSCKAVR